MAKIFTRATVPDDLAQAWLQHLRDFDTAHPDCHFEVVLESETQSVADVMRAIDIHPALDTQLFARREPWTCGHVAGAMCAECYRLLAQRAHELAEEVIERRAG